ncbi:PPTA domain-containing protein/LRR_4 domain-containing protein [Cephalotus follicularis]|uniref:Geranylgeranyl transferase type-2 subunit alpha n=1 Tax=Cephalotus follicularis TaxID=3775 RepID=A0A1Q3BFP1_CEPFO|nr:PPTA domain-containing protein/LRR_4 domain-containing protein [Cephalotus follicularis]
MHGRPRKAPKPEDEAASAAKAEKLRLLQSQFLSNHNNKIYTKEAVDLSATLLEINPESYTAWNYRKLAVEHHLSLLESDPDSVNSLLNEELRVVENALRQNIKSYGAWHHRKWVLSKGNTSIDHELRLLDKFQRVDSRNFHAWNYRRFLAALMNRSDQDELKYTEDMINTNFSNYSAWHNRSVLLSNLLKKKAEGFLSKEDILSEEYQFVHQAIFTDPDDQSGWFYHLWLLEQTVKDASPLLVSSWPAHGSAVNQLGDWCLDSSASSPITSFYSGLGAFPLVLYFNQAVEGVNSSTVTVESALDKNKDLIWKPLSANNSHTSQLWFTHLHFPDKKIQSLEALPVEVSLGHSQGIISSSGMHYTHPSRFSFTVRTQPVETDFAGAHQEEIISWKDEYFHIYETHSQELSLAVSFDQLHFRNGHESTTSDWRAPDWRAQVIDEEIECFRELLRSDGLKDCKIGKLTLARLLTANDKMVFPCSNKLNHSEVLELYSELMTLDPSHYHYYKDEHSLVLLQQVISNTDSMLRHSFHFRGLTSLTIGSPTCLRLNNLSLSRIGSFEKLLWVQMLDLSHNELRSIEGLEAMQVLSCLNLSKNKLSSFTALEPLRRMESLRVLDISYNEIGTHSVDTTKYLCSSPLSHSVEIEWNHDEIVTVWEAFYLLKGLNLTQLDIVGNAIADEKFKLFLVKFLPALKWLDGKHLL